MWVGVPWELRSENQLNELIEAKEPETQVLEFKSQASFLGEKEKLELLKDVTGMANGGGGTIVIGIKEDGQNRAGAITPIKGHDVEGQVVKILRSGTQPPVLANVQTIEVEGGGVVVIDVIQSALGPVQVRHRTGHYYYRRQVTSVAEMTEQEVRDAYVLAARGDDHRDKEWSGLGLPISLTAACPVVAVAGVTRGAAREVFDPRTFGTKEAVMPSPVAHYLDRLYIGLGNLLPSYMADGIVLASHEHLNQPQAVRLHRSGAAGFSVALRESFGLTALAHGLNATLAYLGWFWSEVDLHQPIELRIAISNLIGSQIGADQLSGFPRAFKAPIGIGDDTVRFGADVIATELHRASVRHPIIFKVVNRVANAFGLPGFDEGFHVGSLWREGRRINGIILDQDRCYDYGRRSDVLRVDSNGHVQETSHGYHVGYIDGGVLMDLDGNVYCHTEFAVGGGCPDDALPLATHEDRALGMVRLDAGTLSYAGSKPVPTRQWTSETLEAMLERHREQLPC